MEESLNAANALAGGPPASTNATAVLAGCADVKCKTLDVAAVQKAATAPGVKAIVLAMGIDGSVEGEGSDRMDIRMPGQQMVFVEAVLNATASARASGSVRVVLLMFNGGMVTVEHLKNAEGLAIVEAWYPGATGGQAVAESLFGLPGSNRFGKLPFTFYAYNYTQLNTFDNMNMTKTPGQSGRTYKYLKDKSLALWPFGYGDSYTTFTLTAVPTGHGATSTLADADATFFFRVGYRR
jgi:beta-glucosidase